MLRHVVTAQLLRVDHSLSLAHPVKEGSKKPRRSRHSTPAVLIIPRGGNPREPHLVTLESPHGPWDEAAPVRVMTDPHTVMCAEDIGDDSKAHRTADVVVHRAPSGDHNLPCPLGGDLDCDIAASNLATWSMLRLRDNKVVGIKGPAALLARTTPSWLAVYGSVVHCWLAAGMPIGILGDAVVGVGHYYVGTSTRGRRFSVAGRAHMFIHPVGSAAAFTRVI
jgi:hypothetical protein